MSSFIAPVAPVEMVVIGFPTTEFDGSIAPAIAQLVANGTVRILDLMFVSKSEDEVVTFVEVADMDADGIGEFTVLVEDIPGLIGSEDVEAVAEGLPPGTSAALIAWEDTWALPVVSAITANGGFLIAHERVGAAELSAVLEVLALEDELESI